MHFGKQNEQTKSKISHEITNGDREYCSLRYSRIADKHIRVHLVTIHVVNDAIGAAESGQSSVRCHGVVKDSLQLPTCGLVRHFKAIGVL